MKKRLKPLACLFLPIIMMLSVATSAFAEDITYDPPNKWEYIEKDGYTSMKEDSFGGEAVFQFTSRGPSADRYEQTFPAVAAGSYVLTIAAATENLEMSLFVDGQRQLVVLDTQMSLEVYNVTLNVPTQRDVTIALRFTGVSGVQPGKCAILGPVLTRDGNALPEPEPEINLLVNPSFENALAGWTQYDEIHSGLAEHISNGGFASAAFMYEKHEGLVNYLEQKVSAQQGVYLFDAYVYTQEPLAGVGAMLMMEALDNSGNVIATAASSAVNSTDKTWQKLSVTMDAPAGTAKLVVKVGGVYCTGEFAVDDARLAHSA